MSFRSVTAWAPNSPYGDHDGWPRCYYDSGRFCGQEAFICACPSCPVKVMADNAAFALRRRLEADGRRDDAT